MVVLDTAQDPALPRLLYEHPLNERSRTLLRLSHLFDQFEHNHKAADPWQSRLALQALLEVGAILARADIKSEFIKQIDQQRQALERLTSRRGVDQATLGRVLDDLAATRQRLQQAPGHLGKQLRNHDFLKSVAQRFTIPGGSFEFDLPQLHLWLHRPPARRAAELENWRREVALVADATELLLGLLRNSADPRPQVAESGFYQQNLEPQKREVEMIQVSLEADLDLYAEISGNKHRFCIRFMEGGALDSPTTTEKTVPFELKTCAL